MVAVKPETRQAAKDVICQLLMTAGGTIRGKVRLNKAFYFAHLYYWRDGTGILTDYPIVRLPFGPAIDELDLLLEELQTAELIEVATSPNGPYVECVYKLRTGKIPPPEGARLTALQAAVELVESRTAAELSELTHEHSRRWQETSDGREMNIYLDLLSDEELRAARLAVERIRVQAER